jgi:N-acetylneuraminic acid mutarotase
MVGGKVYVFGGYLSFAGQTPIVQAYDPATDAWGQDRASMNVARWDHAGVALNGKVYAIGGVNQTAGGFAVQNAVEEYDPGTDSWTLKAPLPTARTGLVAVASGGRIYAIGGFDGTQVVNIVESYDPVTDSWSRLLAATR